jgi:hypothetical protein
VKRHHPEIEGEHSDCPAASLSSSRCSISVRFVTYI